MIGIVKLVRYKTSFIFNHRTIEQHAACLVSLLETCLGYNLRPPLNGGHEPPHAKFASDVMSCIFRVTFYAPFSFQLLQGYCR